jgi:hypothetical protein
MIKFRNWVFSPHFLNGETNSCYAQEDQSIRMKKSISNTVNSLVSNMSVSSHTRPINHDQIVRVVWGAQTLPPRTSLSLQSESRDRMVSFCLIAFTRFRVRISVCRSAIPIEVLWSSGHRSRGPGFDSRPYHIFWEVGGLERCTLSLVRKIEELIELKSSGSGLENWD